MSEFAAILAQIEHSVKPKAKHKRGAETIRKMCELIKANGEMTARRIAITMGMDESTIRQHIANNPSLFVRSAHATKQGKPYSLRQER